MLKTYNPMQTASEMRAAWGLREISSHFSLGEAESQVIIYYSTSPRLAWVDKVYSPQAANFSEVLARG